MDTLEEVGIVFVSSLQALSMQKTLQDDKDDDGGSHAVVLLRVLGTHRKAD
jgi:hypothetical protein